MRTDIQAKWSGCGIASVAALVGLSYLEAKLVANSLGINTHDERFGQTPRTCKHY
jgi:hypothetical protein